MIKDFVKKHRIQQEELGVLLLHVSGFISVFGQRYLVN